MRKSAIVIVSIVTIFTIILGINYGKYFEEKPYIEKNLFKDEYEKLNKKVNDENGKEYSEVSVPNKNIIKYSSYDEIFEILKTGSGVIYFGYPECPWCRNLITPLFNAATETELDVIYYLNIKDDRDLLILNSENEVVVQKDSSKEYKMLLDILNQKLPDYILTSSDGVEVNTNEKRIYLPMLIFVNNGNIVGVHTGTLDSQEDPYIPLDDRQSEQLMLELMHLISLTKNEICKEAC